MTKNIPTTSIEITLSGKGGPIIQETATDVVNALERSDYYIISPSMRPKADIADYVESQGFLVPKRFSSFEKAVKESDKFLMRTEHPQDYEGESDLFSGETLNSEDFRDSMFGGVGRNIEFGLYAKQANNNRNLDMYCEVHGVNKSDFLENFSCSYWEYIEGGNFTVIQDDVLDGVFHIYGPHPTEKSDKRYICIKDGSIISDSAGLGMFDESEEMLRMYTGINSLDRFDSNHRPIMEFQVGEDGKTYFLQYHKCRDKDHNEDFCLDRNLEEGEIQASFVRGKTDKEGVTFDASNWVWGGFIWDNGGVNFGQLQSIIYSKKFIIADGVNEGLKNVNGLHFNVTIGHKSDIFIGIDAKNLYIEDVPFSPLMTHMFHQGNDGFTLPVRIVSDGDKAYVKVCINKSELRKLLAAVGEDLDAWLEKHLKFVSEIKG